MVFSVFSVFSVFFTFSVFPVFSVSPSSRDLLKLCGYRRENEHVSKKWWQRKKMDIQIHHPDLIFYLISRTLQKARAHNVTF